eukprot:3140744-Pleurochrysis_carterae.AAC.1
MAGVAVATTVAPDGDTLSAGTCAKRGERVVGGTGLEDGAGAIAENVRGMRGSEVAAAPPFTSTRSVRNCRSEADHVACASAR